MKMDAIERDEDGNEITTWFAFYSQREKREYYFEPVSGQTSWTTPTTGVVSKLPGSPAHKPKISWYRRWILPVITHPLVAILLLLSNIVLLFVYLQGEQSLSFLPLSTSTAAMEQVMHRLGEESPNIPYHSIEGVTIGDTLYLEHSEVPLGIEESTVVRETELQSVPTAEESIDIDSLEEPVDYDAKSDISPRDGQIDVDDSSSEPTEGEDSRIHRTSSYFEQHDGNGGRDGDNYGSVGSEHAQSGIDEITIAISETESDDDLDQSRNKLERAAMDSASASTDQRKTHSVTGDNQERKGVEEDKNAESATEENQERKGVEEDKNAESATEENQERKGMEEDKNAESVLESETIRESTRIDHDASADESGSKDPVNDSNESTQAIGDLDSLSSDRDIEGKAPVQTQNANSELDEEALIASSVGSSTEGNSGNEEEYMRTVHVAPVDQSTGANTNSSQSRDLAVEKEENSEPRSSIRDESSENSVHHFEIQKGEMRAENAGLSEDIDVDSAQNEKQLQEERSVDRDVVELSVPTSVTFDDKEKSAQADIEPSNPLTEGAMKDAVDGQPQDDTNHPGSDAEEEDSNSSSDSTPLDSSSEFGQDEESNRDSSDAVRSTTTDSEDLVDHHKERVMDSREAGKSSIEDEVSTFSFDDIAGSITEAITQGKVVMERLADEAIAAGHDLDLTPDIEGHEVKLPLSSDILT